MGADEYHPISHHGTNLTADGGIGYTVVDSIDSMVIMGLTEEYERAREWIANKLTFDVNGNVSTFEVRLPVLHFFRSSTCSWSLRTSATYTADDHPCARRTSCDVPPDRGRNVPGEGEGLGGPHHSGI